MDNDQLRRIFGASMGYILANAKTDEEGVVMVKELKEYLKEKQEDISNENNNR